MAEVNVKQTVGAPAERVWQVVGNPGGIAEWVPALEKSTMESGTKRRCWLEGGGELEEEIVSRDDAARRYSYTITAGPLPVSNYRGTLAVADNGDGTSTVTWHTTFDTEGDPAEVQGMLEGTFAGALEHLDTMLRG